MTTTTMSEQDALRIAREVAGDTCALDTHHGGDSRTDRAIKIWACDRDTADDVGPRIAAALGGAYRSSAGFCVVWF